MGCHCSRFRSSESLVRQSSGPIKRRSNSLLMSGASETSDIREFYRLGPVLGSGSFGQVRVCLHCKTEQQYACKIMTKNPGKHKRPMSHPVSNVKMFRNEMNILRSLDHPNVIKLIETFEDRHFLYAIMEKCNGGELFTRIVKKRRFSEMEASCLCREMIAAISYIHSKSIVHRDVKAENFLFSCNRAARVNRLVLIDFGMSVQLTEGDKYLRQVCGSPHYVAPELIRRYYKKEVDLWALGVVVFLMLYGRYPFEGADEKAIAHKILKNEPNYQRSSTPPSELATQFIQGLLEKNPARRFTSQEAMRHPWIIQYAQHSVTTVITLPNNSQSPQLSMKSRVTKEKRRQQKKAEMSEGSGVSMLDDLFQTEVPDSVPVHPRIKPRPTSQLQPRPQGSAKMPQFISGDSRDLASVDAALARVTFPSPLDDIAESIYTTLSDSPAPSDNYIYEGPAKTDLSKKVISLPMNYDFLCREDPLRGSLISRSISGGETKSRSSFLKSMAAEDRATSLNHQNSTLHNPQSFDASDGRRLGKVATGRHSMSVMQHGMPPSRRFSQEFLTPRLTLEDEQSQLPKNVADDISDDDLIFTTLTMLEECTVVDTNPAPWDSDENSARRTRMKSDRLFPPRRRTAGNLGGDHLVRRHLHEELQLRRRRQMAATAARREAACKAIRVEPLARRKFTQPRQAAPSIKHRS